MLSMIRSILASAHPTISVQLSDKVPKAIAARLSSEQPSS